MKLRKKKGFTIIELVIVIAVIGVLTAVLVPTFVNLTQRANQTSDQSLVKNLNIAMAAQEGESGKKNSTYNDAITYLDNYGYRLANLATKAGEDLLWNSKSNRFLLNNAETVAADRTQTGAEEVDYWTIKDAIPEGSKYSIYAGLNFVEDPTDGIVVNGIGFDAGSHNFSKINYTNTSSAKEVVIRTNGGSVTVNAPSDTVRHYGSANVTNINAVSPSSYYEYGSVNQINIAKGRLVLTNEKDSSVNTVYLKKTEDNYDGIILATQNGAKLPSYIARDSVEEPESGEKLVVTIQTNVNEQGQSPEKTESIYLYPAKDVKEETNGYDVTDLGLLVVEAVSNDARAEAAEVITDPETLEKVEATKADCVAIIDSIGYATFAAAWNAGTNKTVTLLKDVTLNGIPVVSTKTVDLNQHSLTINGASLGDGQECGIWICCDWGNGYDGKLTLKNGTLNLPGTNYSKYGIYCYGSLLNCQNLKIESSCTETIHFEGHQYGTNYTSELNNVTINSSGTGIQSNGYKGSWFGDVIPTVNISNSKVTSESGAAFAINGSKANVSDSTFTPAAGQKSLFVYSNGTASGLAPELTLTGIVVCNGDSDYNKLAKSAGTVTIKEGTYNFNPTSYVDGEIYSVTNKDNTWTVAIK